ncbi:MAG: DNA replication/repair protein RecF [Alphaproteobacteria bacterium]|nr:DNA replication/repair protein RecF [Alphaproteobacteria bacterium]
MTGLATLSPMIERQGGAVAGARHGGAPLALSRLTVTDFRCYGRARLDLDTGLDGGMVILTGPNGAGKTNLLEAVSLLTPGKGLRGARSQEIARSAGGGGWGVAAEIDPGDGVPVGLGTGVEPGGERRAVRVDGENASQADLARYLAAVWLTPQMDRLFLDGPGGRRRFFDRLVYGFDTSHAGRVLQYEKALRERSRLLREGQGDAVWLGALETQMAERGVAIAAARRELIRRLNAALVGRGGPFPVPHLALTGELEGWLDDGMKAADVEDRLIESLAGSRAADAETGGASAGPHRSDVSVTHVAKQVPAAIASTGEQKALLISIVIAQAELAVAEQGRCPVLLLDEISAHLDEDRRAHLYAALKALGGQVWMTGTDLSLFEALGGDAQFIRIEDGRIG